MFDCQDRVISRVASPSGRHVAVVNERNCGATTALASSVIVRPSGLRGLGSSRPVFIAESVDSLGVSWASDGILVVHERGGRVFTRDTLASGVRIEYEPLAER